MFVYGVKISILCKLCELYNIISYFFAWVTEKKNVDLRY